MSEHVQLAENEEAFEATVRYRTVGDMSCTGGVPSRAATIEKVVAEIAATRVARRVPRTASARAAMEDREREGDL